MKTTFIRIFTTSKTAEKFASEKKGRVQVKYDWDDMKQRIIKTYIVKY